MKSGDLVKIIRYGHNRKIKLDKNTSHCDYYFYARIDT